MRVPDDGAPPSEGDPDEDGRIIEKTARALVDRHLAAPAIFMLESTRPLSFLASQGMLFLQPIVESVLTIPEYDSFQRMLERRENIGRLIEQIEELEDERITSEARDRKKKA
jgi:hypothetical protein